jgi:conjugal transfer pilin signal peptidase TrbI
MNSRVPISLAMAAATPSSRWIHAVGNFTPQEIWRRFDRAVFEERLIHHFQRWTLIYLLAALATMWFSAHYTLGLNVTESLPGRLFLIDRGENPKRGDYVAFRWNGGGPYPAGSTFIKLLAGLPGDEVTQLDGDYFINCYPVGRAKRLSRQGIELEPGPTGTLPQGAYYVRAPHPDSLDSRYALTGWVTQAQIIGRAHVLF